MSNNKQTEIDEETTNSRRDFLKKAGKLAIYTPPAMMVLMKPSYATMQKSYDGHRQRPSSRHGSRGSHGNRGRHGGGSHGSSRRRHGSNGRGRHDN